MVAGFSQSLTTQRTPLHHLSQSGVLVLDVADGGLVAVAGVQRGDVVLAFDGKPIVGVDDLHRSLTEERAARAPTLTRRAEILSVRMTPGEA